MGKEDAASFRDRILFEKLSQMLFAGSVLDGAIVADGDRYRVFVSWLIALPVFRGGQVNLGGTGALALEADGGSADSFAFFQAVVG